MNRRKFIQTIPAISTIHGIDYKKNNKISCNIYNWLTYYSREGKAWGKNLDMDLAHYAQSGLTAVEPSFDSTQTAQKWIPLLQKYHLSMPSLYVGTVMHKQTELDSSIQMVLDIAQVTKSYGTKIIVSNPSPISWVVKQNKTDEELIIQAKALDLLGSKLRAMGMTLAYHTHDIEMKAGAREFHHMMQNTSPKNLSFCMDVHWIYRGSDNSNVAVFDVLKMYGSRIVELHIRQSINGIWSESFTTDGDIDYKRFATTLKQMKIKPHLVIEQCIEEKSPNTMNVVDAHKMDLRTVTETFLI